VLLPGPGDRVWTEGWARGRSAAHEFISGRRSAAPELVPDRWPAPRTTSPPDPRERSSALRSLPGRRTV